MGGDMQGMNKYSVYRKIRQDRTYRTLGRMSWQRVVLGLVLLASVFFLSGAVSRFFAERGHFRTAERLMVSRRWVETYRPDTLAFIEAGLLYEAGDYEGAYAAFRTQKDSEPARRMASAAAVKLADAKCRAGDYDAAFEAVTAAEPDRLSGELKETYRAVCEALQRHFAPLSDPDAREKALQLQSLLDVQAS